MRIDYDALGASELVGTTPADYLVSLDATLTVWHGETKIYEESAFPIVELARSLKRWLADPLRGEFEFESMSFEEVGSVAIRQNEHGWVFSSIFAELSASSHGDWAAVHRSVTSFVERVEGDLIAFGVDPVDVLGF